MADGRNFLSHFATNARISRCSEQRARSSRDEALKIRKVVGEQLAMYAVHKSSESFTITGQSPAAMQRAINASSTVTRTVIWSVLSRLNLRDTLLQLPCGTSEGVARSPPNQFGPAERDIASELVKNRSWRVEFIMWMMRLTVIPATTNGG